MIRQRYQLISSRDNDDQIILESDWLKSTLGHTQPRVVVLKCYLSLMIISMQKNKQLFVLSSFIAGQIPRLILHSDMMRCTTGHTQTKSSDLKC